MIEYIKLLILAIFTGVTAPLPVSSAAHYSFMNGIMDFSSDQKLFGFYYSAFMVVVSVVIFVALRSIYIKALKSFFNKSTDKVTLAYKDRQKNIMLSVIPCLVLFVPVSSEMLLCDYFEKFLSVNSLLIVSVASIISGLFLIISIWYTKQDHNKTKRSVDTKHVIRMSIYNLIANIVPGVSKVSVCATNLLICDVEPKVITREVFLYLAPQMLLFNLVKVIRSLVSGLAFDPIALIIGIAAVAGAGALIVSLTAKVNMKKLYTFFSIYSIVFGVFAGVVSFIIK